MILSENLISECIEKCLPRRKPTCPVARRRRWYGEAFLRGENGDCIALYIPERIVDYVDCLPRKMPASLEINSLMGPKAISWWVRVRDFERSFKRKAHKF